MPCPSSICPFTPCVHQDRVEILHQPEVADPQRRPRAGRQAASRVRKYTVKRRLEASVTLPQIQKHGFTHPANGRFLMLPWEFDVVLALETKAVSQVLLAVLRSTIGYPGDGPKDRAIWAEISTYDLASTGFMSRGAAQRGLRDALKKGYLLRREIVQADATEEADAPENAHVVRYEYAVKWKIIQN
jgi:hypothetical protein